MASPFDIAAPVAAAQTVDAASSEYAKPKNEAEAAKQFEAMLIGEMLRTAHESGPGLGGEEDSSGETMWDLSAQEFAQVLADKGGMGLAQLIAQGLRERASSF